MKINDHSHAAGSPASAPELNRANSVNAEFRGYGPSSRRDVSLDRVEVSDFAEQVLNLMDIEATQRSEHVEQLRQVYRAGSYRENAEAISRQMVAEALQDGPSAVAH